MKSLKKKLKNSYYKLDERKTLYTKFSRFKFRKINHPRFLSPSLKKKKKGILPIPRKKPDKNCFSDRIEDSGMDEKRRDGGANMAATAVGTWRASDGQTSSSPIYKNFCFASPACLYRFRRIRRVSTVTARWNIARDNNKQTHSNEPRFY